MGSYTLHTSHIKKKKKKADFTYQNNEVVLPPTWKANTKKEPHLTLIQAERQTPRI